MIKHNRKPSRPGVLLEELFLKPRNINITDFADATGFCGCYRHQP